MTEHIAARLKALWEAEALYHLTTVHEVAVAILAEYPTATHLVLEEDFGDGLHWAADRVVDLGTPTVDDDAVLDLDEADDYLDSGAVRVRPPTLADIEEFSEFYAPLTDLPNHMPDDERFTGVLQYLDATERRQTPRLLVNLPAARDLVLPDPPTEEEGGQ